DARRPARRRLRAAPRHRADRVVERAELTPPPAPGEGRAMGPPMSPPLPTAALTGADLFELLLALVAGAAAVYVLLPRPRPLPSVWGAAAAAAALFVAGATVVRVGVFDAETFLFYVFAGTAVLSGGLLVTQHRPARAALSFALVILSVSGLFLLLAAPFL